MPNGPIILDTNLLVLFVVGTKFKKYIGRDKRLKEYTIEDFELLEGLLTTASELVVTPHILAETSNLMGHFHDPDRTIIFKFFRTVIERWPEKQIVSSVACKRPEFVRLGLSDVVILEALQGTTRLITADFDLYMSALTHKLEVVNFNHLRIFRH